MRNKIVAGNWKMNLNLEQAQTLASEIVNIYQDETKRSVKVVLAPPFPFLTSVHHLVKNNPSFHVAGQNLHEEEKGAFTGETSAAMLHSAGCSHVIIGHSERRQYFNESNELILAKIKRALSSGLTPIVCVGEPLAERDAGRAYSFVENQLVEGPLMLSPSEFAKVILAYEPVWAIGTGKTATPEQAQEMHAFIRQLVEKKFGTAIASACPILYGGSVTPANSSSLFSQADIDGGLVGGASLKSRDFIEIIKTAQ